ncbi:MAG: metallophosphoesterase family protein [Syntrophobacteraceae bacterium]|nr:metallophosphoesterase family protein [Syntrophobacteraceae bacterium]
MKIYFFGDIHGNEYGLEACLEHIGQVKPDEIYCLGDLVGWLPFGDRTLSKMRSSGFPCVAGNHDLMVAGVFKDYPQQLDRIEATAFNAGLISTIPGAVEFLCGLPLFIEKDNFFVTHHSPFHLPFQGKAPTIECFDYLTEAALEACLVEWSYFPKPLIFSGHDHVPAIYELPGDLSAPPGLGDVVVHKLSADRGITIRLKPGARYWVKAGSLAMNRDSVPVANSVLYDTVEETITFFRLPFATGSLCRELESHFFGPTLPAIRKYIALLADCGS